MLKISDNIYSKRKEKNITQEELADYMMVTKASVSKWETGQSYPDILLLPKLAAFFNISVDELIGYQPQLSTEQIRKLYESFLNDVAKGEFENTIKRAQSVAHQYYSCFELLYYVGVFIVNHVSLIKDEKKIREYVEYAEGLFKRICEETEDTALINKALNMRGLCLIQLGHSKEALEILPSSEELFISTDCLAASAYLHTKEFEEADKQLQIFIYKNITQLMTFLSMRLTLKTDDWEETAKRMKGLIEIFNLSELNISLVLNFYLSVAIKYSREESSKADQYLEKYFMILIENEKYPMEIRGDKYFDKVDKWINENLLLGIQPMRDKKSIYKSFISMAAENKELEKALSSGKIKKLIERLEEKIK